MEQVEAVKDGMIEMEPAKLAGLDGVGAQHLARGLHLALAQGTVGVALGAAAEKRLGELAGLQGKRRVARLQAIQ